VAARNAKPTKVAPCFAGAKYDRAVTTKVVTRAAMSGFAALGRGKTSRGVASDRGA